MPQVQTLTTLGEGEATSINGRTFECKTYHRNYLWEDKRCCRVSGSTVVL